MTVYPHSHVLTSPRGYCIRFGIIV